MNVCRSSRRLSVRVKDRPKIKLNKLMKTSAACILRLEFGFAGSVHQLADDCMPQFYGQNETFRSSRCHTPA